MRIFVVLVALLVPCGFVAAQSTPVPASASLSWTLPTTALDDSPLTGPQALTKVQIFASSSPIADAFIGQPVAEIAGDATRYAHTATVPNGSTLYFRVKACNVAGCSPMSQQASKVIQVAAPGSPGNVTVTITLVIQQTP